MWFGLIDFHQSCVVSGSQQKTDALITLTHMHLHRHIQTHIHTPVCSLESFDLSRHMPSTYIAIGLAVTLETYDGNLTHAHIHKYIQAYTDTRIHHNVD